MYRRDFRGKGSGEEYGEEILEERRVVKCVGKAATLKRHGWSVLL